MRIRRVFILALFGVACGGEPAPEANVQIEFKRHALECAVPTGTLGAKLEASGVVGVCPLTIEADLTVSGTCRGVPGGEIRVFRLVYFSTIDREYDIATAVTQLDLRNEKEQSLVLDFSDVGLDTEIDDDGDQQTNIVEVCCGSHPGLSNTTCM